MNERQLFNDGTGPLVIDPSKPLAISHWVYVDNLGLICLGEEVLKQRLSGVVSHFNSVGLTMHETQAGSASMVRLGCRLDCVGHKTQLTVERRMKLAKALRAVLRRRTVSGIVFEVVLGHATFCCLNNRLTLSVFHTIYKFIRNISCPQTLMGLGAGRATVLFWSPYKHGKQLADAVVQTELC